MIICLSAGHNVINGGNFDTGAIGNGLREADVSRETVRLLKKELEARGHIVHDVTPYNMRFTNKKKAHEERAKRVNRIKPDLYLDIHLNSGGGTGPETWVYSTKSKGYPFGRAIVNSISKMTGLRNRGVKVKPSYWSLSMTTCPSVIVEGAFIDSKKDMDILTPAIYSKAVAVAIGGDKVDNKEEVNKYHKDGVKFVQERGIMKGYGDGTFRPKQAVTREELATIIKRIME